ncbi:MAG: methylmalonyl Co-A mutase-associated GTPase MeaB [Kineosporiaceae bacterium]
MTRAVWVGDAVALPSADAPRPHAVATAGLRRARVPVDVPDLAARLAAGERGALARAITLAESSRACDRDAADAVLARLAVGAQRARRIGVTGPPGAGKSTLIEALGTGLVEGGHRVAVLAVDPSSQRSGGSVLGDRTRMSRLAAHPRAYVRPTPSGGTLGGLARATETVIALVEAAGHGVVLVETVGVGQSEASVAALVDVVLLATPPRAGDELQGIKRGLLEVVDAVVVTKADGPHAVDARAAQGELRRALRVLHPPQRCPPVLTCSSTTGDGVPELSALLLDLAGSAASGTSPGTASGALDVTLTGVWDALAQRLLDAARADPAVRAALAGAAADLAAGTLTVTAAARRLHDVHRSSPHR